MAEQLQSLKDTFRERGREAVVTQLQSCAQKGLRATARAAGLPQNGTCACIHTGGRGLRRTVATEFNKVCDTLCNTLWYELKLCVLVAIFLHVFDCRSVGMNMQWSLVWL